MVTINLLTPFRYGPLFDPEARGFMRYVPRRPWWPVLPFLVLASPAVAAVMAVDALTRKTQQPAR